MGNAKWRTVALQYKKLLCKIYYFQKSKPGGAPCSRYTGGNTAVVQHNQRWLSYYLHCDGHFLKEKPEFSSVSDSDETNSLTSEQTICTLKDINPDVPNHSPVFHYKWLKLRSNVYKCGSFILIKRDNFSPTFGKIIDVLEVDRYIFFQVEVYASCGFCSHYNSFVVTSRNVSQFVDVHDLDDHHSLLARRCYNLADNRLYITMPYVF